MYVALYGNETWPAQKQDVIRLERNDARKVRWICIVRPEDRISTEGLGTRLS